MKLFNRLNSHQPLSPMDRRDNNNRLIQEMGISCLENLPVLESSEEVQLKEVDIIIKRAIACLLVIQLACDICGNGDYQESKSIISDLLKKFQVEECLLSHEQRLFDQDYTEQDAINVAWTYECYWSLIWALGLIEDDDLKVPNTICDCERAINFVKNCNNFKEFKDKTKLRSIEEVLDMTDLYYRYHWACVEKSINPQTNIGDLNSEVVLERRKGLEWLISTKDDWNEISLDT